MSERKWELSLGDLVEAHGQACGVVPKTATTADALYCAIAICERLEAVLEALERTEAHGPHH